MHRNPVDVVVAGAGPNGLMVACELALAGVRPVVLDALPGPSAEPKANGLVGQVIRILDMRGLYQEFAGTSEPPQPIPGWIFSGMRLSFAGMTDNPMYALPIPQPKVVRLLDERARKLGVDVRWGHQLTELARDDDGVRLFVETADGTYDLEARYLVGADGGRSLVRKSTGIDFPGHTAPMVGRLAHVSLPDNLRTADGGVNIPGVGPLPGGHNRLERGGFIFAEFEPGRPLMGTLEFDTDSVADDTTLSFDEFRESLCRVTGVDVPIDPPHGPGPMRCAGSRVRTPGRPIATATAMSFLSATPHTYIPQWADPASISVCRMPSIWAGNWLPR